MDQVEEEEGHDFCWDNLFPRERNSQEQSPSGEAVDPMASFPSPERKPSPLNLLTTFGFSFEHLEELSHYPHDQLTPENMTVLLQAIQKHKLAPKLPRLPLKSSEKETVSSADGCGPTVKKKVIDYGHKSKYGYNEGPMEMNASSIATDEGVEGCPTQQPESVPAGASSVISSPKNPTKELMRQAGSTPNLQASPLVAPAKKAPLAELQAPARVPAMMPPAVLPMPQPVIPPVILPVLMPVLSQRPPPFAPEFLSRHGSYEHTLMADSSSHPCRTVDSQESFWKEAEDPGTVKASWLPDFSQTDKEKEKKLPTAPQICDYYAVTPRIFPHVCSLCNEDCRDKKDWIQHQNTLLHIVNCRWLLQQYPDWTPETLSSPRRNKDDRQEMQESRRRCASPSPKRSRCSSSGHARHRTRSQSRSSERHRTSRPRSRSPRCLPSPRHRSRSPRQSLHSSRQSQSSASKQRRAGSSAGLTAAPSVSQKVAAQADQAVSSSKEASRMQTSAGEAAVSSQPVSSKAETSGVGRPSPRPATPGPCKAKNRGVRQQLVLGNSPPRPGLAAVSSHLVGSKAETSVVAHPWIQPGTPAPSKLKIRGLKQKLITGSVPPCPGEATVSSQPVSIKTETSGLAHPSPQTATSGPCKAKIRGVKQKLVAGSVPPRPGAAALSSQPVRSKAEISGVARPQAATSGPSKARIRGVKQKQAVPGNVPPFPGKAVVSSKAESSGVEESQGVAQKVVLGGALPCQKVAAVSSQPVRSKAETSGLAPPSPQTATSGPSKAKIQGVKQKVPGSVPPLPGKAAVCPQPVSSKAETFGVARPSPQTATSRLCKAKIRGVKQKLVDGSISSCSGEATVHSQPLRSKAEISGVACPSPHQGTSGPCKAKNQDVVPGSIPSGPDLFKPAAKPRVWVCGGSLVVSAQKWDLQKRQFGQLDWLQQNITLEWHGQEDLTWAQLVATVQKLAAQGQAPDVLILHLGEKDLLSTPWPALSQTIRREVGLLKEAFPKVRLMWSEMLPQNIRPAGMEACNVEELLREANLVVGGFISGLGGMVIKHGEIANCVFTLNLEGGGLSYIGLDLFLEDIRNAVRAHVLQSSGAAGGGLQGGRNASPFASLAASAGLGTMSQEAAIEGNQTVSSSKEASQTPTNTGRSAVSSQLASWVSHRKEMQTVGQKHMVGKFRFCSRSSDRPGSSSKPRLWICGDAMVISAQKRASSTAAGSQLGLEQRAVLEWHGQEKLKWIQLLPFLHNLVTWHQAPDVLIIHFGDEDLARAFDHNLSDRVIRELVLLKTLFPSIPLIWSGIIPRSSWHEKRADMIRTAVHKVVGGSVRRHGGHVIEHLRISSKDPKLHLDEANLSHAGLDIFLEDIRSGILTYMLKCSRRTGDGLKEGMSLPPPSSPATPSGLPFGSRESVTQEDEVVSSSEDASRMHTSAGEAPVSSKAETSGVGCPSPQPGTSGTFRTENRDVEQNLVFGNVSLCSGSAGHLSKPRIWLCGHSLVNAAQERAFATSTGFQLGLDERIVLEWHGWYGLTWAQLIPYLQDLATWLQPPDVLILHLGESDIMFTIYIGFLIETIQRELFLVKELFPNVKVVWSEMMPWGNWLELPSASSKKESLRKVNLDVGQYVKDHGGAVVKHPRISFEDLELYTCQAKLSDAGLDIFLEDIKHGILAHLVQSGGAARKEFEEGTRLSPSASPAAPTSLSSMSGEITREDEAVSSTKEVSGMQISTRATAVSPQPVSNKAETSYVASPSSQPGTFGAFRTENQDVEQQTLAFQSIPPCLGEAAMSSQPVSGKADTSDASGPGPQSGMPGASKVKHQNEDQKPVTESFVPCTGEGAVSSAPVSIKAESSEVAIPSPQPGTSRPCKVENQDEEQKLVAGSASPCPGEGAVSSPPVKIKAETSEVAVPSPQPGTSRPCKVENRDEEQKLVAGSASPCPGEGAVSSPPVSIKAQTSEVAIPSPQPGTSGPCKVENQELVAGSVSPCPKQEAPRWRVWVCGHSVVVSAEQQASGTGAGPQLGLEGDVVLEWHGQEDLTWTRLVPTLQSLAAQGQAPDVLIIHLGEKDLESHRGAHLSGTIRKELVLVKDLFPQVRILWSNLLLRRRGAGRTGSRMANRARTMVNLEVGSFIGTLGGAVLEHGAIPHTDPDFYVDGDSLSRRGLDVFLEDVKNGILAHLPS